MKICGKTGTIYAIAYVKEKGIVNSLDTFSQNN